MALIYFRAKDTSN